MSDSKITVAAFVLGKDSLTLFLVDGATKKVPQGDRRVKDILAKIAGPIALNQTVEIDLGDTEERNTYTEFNKEAGGIKLVRIAKKFLGQLLAGAKGRKEEEARLASEAAAFAQAEAKVRAFLEKDKPASEKKEWTGQLGEGLYKDKPTTAVPLSEVMGNVPTKSLDAPAGDDVLVAITECGQVLPEAEKLLNQFAHVNKHGNRQGLENLIKRLAHNIHERQHSVQDVLTFVQKSDLSIADNGDIIAYKLLTNTADHAVKPEHRGEDFSYDPYTKKVPQKVGTFVKVNEALIDKDRARECSCGLHVCRIGYINNYTGNLIYMVKVRPEDIVTVPHRDPNKVRVSGYHIVAKLSDTEYKQVKSGGFKEESLKLLTAIIQGDHTPITHITEITERMGGGIIRTQVDAEGHAVERTEATKAIAAAAQVEDVADNGKNVMAERHKVDPKELAKKLTPTAANAPSASAPTKADQAKALYAIMNSSTRKDAERRAAAINLQNLKKSAKTSWLKLGLSDAVGLQIEEILTITDDVKKETKSQVPAGTKEVVNTAPKTKSVTSIDPRDQKKTPTPAKTKVDTTFNDAKAIAKARGADDNAASAIAYLKVGKMSKAEIARKFNTSTRSVGRWQEKWG